MRTQPRPKWPAAGSRIVGEAQPEPGGGERSEGATPLSRALSKTVLRESPFFMRDEVRSL
jgi:hypothetical protein